MTSTLPSPSAGQEREAIDQQVRQVFVSQGPRGLILLCIQLLMEKQGAALTCASKQEGGEPVAYYNGNWTLTPRAYADAIKRDPEVFADMKPAYAAPQPPLAGAGEAVEVLLRSPAWVRAAISRLSEDGSRERAAQDALVLEQIAAALNPKPAPLNGGCGDGESDHG